MSKCRKLNNWVTSTKQLLYLVGEYEVWLYRDSVTNINFHLSVIWQIIFNQGKHDLVGL